MFAKEPLGAVVPVVLLVWDVDEFGQRRHELEDDRRGQVVLPPRLQGARRSRVRVTRSQDTQRKECAAGS